MKKIISIGLLLLTAIAMLKSLSTSESSMEEGKSWGTPTFFSITHTASGTTRGEFQKWNVAGFFTCLSIPVFVAGYLCGKPRGKGSKAIDQSAVQKPIDPVTEQYTMSK